MGRINLFKVIIYFWIFILYFQVCLVITCCLQSSLISKDLIINTTEEVNKVKKME
jgi:hypothetical protein